MAFLQWGGGNARGLIQSINTKRGLLTNLELEFHSNPSNQQLANTRNAIKSELKELVAQENTYWHQRSKISWMKDGNRNSKFFHAMASQRKRSNEILMLQDSSSKWHSQQFDLQRVASDYFQSIFTSASTSSVQHVINNIREVVTPDMNGTLLAKFTHDEVKRALFQMHPTKAQGPNGMNPLFFQKYWHIVGTDVSNAVLDCINYGNILHSINFTHITLIPKRKNPDFMSHFWPINLCNVIFNLKVLANRPKLILGSIISECQSAFVANRMTTNNILIYFKTLHYMKSKRQGNTAHMALKFNMSNAYDKVEWDYLKDLMLKIGFHHKWVDLIMAGVSSVSYSVLVNGAPSGFIKPSRGICQRDPLSPYLFLLCTKGFSVLLRNVAHHRDLHVVICSQNGPSITYLLFADDSLLFCNGSLSECHIIKEILQAYELASRQKINNDKSSIFFSTNTPQSLWEEIKRFFNANSNMPLEKYLGLPPIIGRGKKQSL